MSNKLEQIVEKQKIPYFCHFTDIFNAKSIMNEGILSVDLLNQYKIPHSRNDANRYDRHTSHNCLSIGFPNDALFSRFRAKAGGNWVVFLIKPSILWESDSKFCITNSAKGCGRYIGNHPDYFESFFADTSASSTRSSAQLLSYMPTDPQAEILIPERIPKKYISHCVVENETVTRRLPANQGFYLSRPSFFGTRQEFIRQIIKGQKERK